MTFGAYLGVALALGLVLVLLGVSLKLLQRLTPGTTTGKSRIRMEIIQRMAIGPKQGVAVVRIGERVMAISTGEGGMRRLLELDEVEAKTVLAPVQSNTAPGRVPRGDFRATLGTALKTAGLRSAIVLALLLPVAASGAQVAATPPVASPIVAPVATPAATRTAIVATPKPAAQKSAAQKSAATSTAAKAGTATTATATAAAPSSPVPLPAAGAALALTKLAPSMDLRVGPDGGDRSGLHLNGTVGIVVMMGLMTLLPTLLLMMTSFTRILIVLHFLRQALGTQNAPPAQLVAAIALLLTGFVMAPTLTVLNRDALQPWMAGTIDQGQMLERGAVPFRAFMLRQTRDHDLQVFVDLGKGVRPTTAAEVPMVTLMSAFVTSELRTAFQIGFALFLPFIIIDVVVSSVLMSMGMFMLPPAMISLPFKLLLFVLVDGWTLIVQSLVASFR